MGRQLELIDESGKTYKVKVQDVKIMYLVDELIKCLPDEKGFGYTAKFHAYLRHTEYLYCLLNPNILPNI